MRIRPAGPLLPALAFAVAGCRGGSGDAHGGAECSKVPPQVTADKVCVAVLSTVGAKASIPARASRTRVGAVVPYGLPRGAVALAAAAKEDG